MNAHVWSLSWAFLRRDWRAGELRLLWLALAVAVGSASAVTFFTDRIDQALNLQASELLAADLRLVSDRPFPPDYRDAIEAQGLRQAELRTFRSMAVTDKGARLVEVKAAGAGYPLRGTLKIADSTFGTPRPTHGLPPRGTTWIDQRLSTALGLQVGERIQLGETAFSIDAVLVYEPDRAGNLFSIAPRVLISLDDLPGTQLIQPGSRLSYGLLAAGDEDRLAALRGELADRLQRGERIEDTSDGRPEIRGALDRAQQFLGLAALVSVVLASVALALAARRFSDRHLDSCAIMRCLGGSQNFIMAVFLWEMIWVAVLGSLLGCAIGYAAQWGLSRLLGALVMAELPPPGWAPVWLGLAMGLVTVGGFVLPSLLRLKQVSTLRVLRRELGAPGIGALSALGLGIAAVVALAWLQAGDTRLAATLILGLAGAAAVFMLTALLSLWGLRTWLKRAGPGFRLGVNAMLRRRGTTIIQVVAFGIGIAVLLLLSLVRSDMLGAWQAKIPERAPNYFLINIQPAQVTDLQAFLRDHDIDDPRLYPMVRARLVAINDQPVSGDDYADERAARLAERETNMSWTAELPVDNVVIAGEWWKEDRSPAPQLSVEQGIADALGIQLGDRLTYNIAGEKLVAPVTSLRTVDWDSFNANFFVIAPPGLLERYPATYITSFFLPSRSAAVLDDMVRRFPGVTVIDISALLEQVRAIIGRITLAVEYVFLFTIAAGLLVMAAAIQATQDERLRENAILRALGARRRRLLGLLWAEFSLLGALAGGVAALVASLLSWGLSEFVFELPYRFNAWIWLLGVGGGALGVGLAGYAGTRKVLARPPLQILREE